VPVGTLENGHGPILAQHGHRATRRAILISGDWAGDADIAIRRSGP
jgi:hypothetical protein